jgi:hypothetical protein
VLVSQWVAAQKPLFCQHLLSLNKGVEMNVGYFNGVKSSKVKQRKVKQRKAK